MTMLLTRTCFSALLVVAVAAPVFAQELDAVPELSGVWDGGPRARPVNGPNMPWTSENFPVLNERGLAFQEVFDVHGMLGPFTGRARGPPSHTPESSGTASSSCANTGAATATTKSALKHVRVNSIVIILRPHNRCGFQPFLGDLTPLSLNH
jgi:hypothetical protein